MSYKTVEVELENGRVAPCGSEQLPAKAHALLTILEGRSGKTQKRRLRYRQDVRRHRRGYDPLAAFTIVRTVSGMRTPTALKPPGRSRLC